LWSSSLRELQGGRNATAAESFFVFLLPKNEPALTKKLAVRKQFLWSSSPTLLRRFAAGYRERNCSMKIKITGSSLSIVRY
jgi:hypothetical protein